MSFPSPFFLILPFYPNISPIFLDADGRVKHWHASTSSCISTILEPNRQTLACGFNHSANQFVTSGSNTKINVYDEKTKQIITTMEPRSVSPYLIFENLKLSYLILQLLFES